MFPKNLLRILPMFAGTAALIAFMESGTVTADSAPNFVFTPPVVLNTTAFAEQSGADLAPVVKSFGPGSWAMLWRSKRSLPSSTSIGAYMYSAVTTNTGATWTFGHVGDAGEYGGVGRSTETQYQIAHDHADNAVAVWQTLDGVYSAWSDDHGGTWSTPIPQGDLGIDVNALAMDDTGTCIAVLGTFYYPSKTRIIVSHDRGKTWTNGPVFDGLTSADLSTDGAGTWLLIGGAELPSTRISHSISRDGGATWPPLTLLEDLPETNIEPDVQSLSFNGAWVAAWRRPGNIGVGTSASGETSWAIGGTPAIGALQSLRNLFVANNQYRIQFVNYPTLQEIAALPGTGWTAPVAVVPAVPDGAGNWLNPSLQPPNTDEARIFYEISTDDRQTWSPAKPLITISPRAQAQDFAPSLVYDPQTGWLCAWYAYDYDTVANNLNTRILFARSPDAKTWSDPITVSAATIGLGTDGAMPALATDGKGHMLVAWTHQLSPEATPAVFDSYSGDGGATWTAPDLVGAGTRAQAAYTGDGTWLVVYGSAEENDGILAARFHKGTWESQAIGRGENFKLAVNPDFVCTVAMTGNASGARGIDIVRSGDGALTWSDIDTIANVDSNTEVLISLDIAALPGGRFRAAWNDHGDGYQYHINVSDSTDAGVSWGAPRMLYSNNVAQEFLRSPHLFTPQPGLEVLLFAHVTVSETCDESGCQPISKSLIRAVYSTDGGIAWSDPIDSNLEPRALARFAVDTDDGFAAGDVASDGSGRIVAVTGHWQKRDIYVSSCDVDAPLSAVTVEVTIDVTPDNAPWVLRDGNYVLYRRTGDQVLHVSPGYLAIEWEPLQNYYEPVDSFQRALVGTQITFNGVYRHFSGNVTINVSPAAAAYTITGGDMSITEGTGPATISGIATGAVSVAWHALEGFDTPPPSSSQQLAEDATITFDGVYVRQRGAAVIHANQPNAPWALVDGDGASHTGIGDATLDGLPTGEIVLTWGPLENLVTPLADTKTLLKNSAVVFSGEYIAVGEGEGEGEGEGFSFFGIQCGGALQAGATKGAAPAKAGIGDGLFLISSIGLLLLSGISRRRSMR